MAKNLLNASRVINNSQFFIQLSQRSHSSIPTSSALRNDLLEKQIIPFSSISAYEQHMNAQRLQLNAFRSYSTPQKSDSFFGKILQNLKDESEKNKELKKGIEGFKRDMEELTKSDTAMKARKKYQKIEVESAEGRQKAMQQLGKLKQKVADAEVMQKASKLTEGAKETVQKVGHNLSQKGEELSKTQAYKAVSSTAEIVKEEIAASALSGAGMRVYQPPKILRRRTEVNPEAEQRIMEADPDSTGVVLHKDSRFSQSWENFKGNNPYVNRVMEWKSKLDESDHAVVRVGILVKDKVQEIFGSVFYTTDLSEALTEICKMDPEFNKDMFLKQTELDLIPNILEAMIRPDLDILKDWTHERAFSITAQEVKQLSALGHIKYSKVLDVDNVDLAMGKVVEDVGPVLAITFQAQMIEYIKNLASGELVSGDPEQVLRRNYVWVFCRDQSELMPRAAWKLLEYSHNSSNQLV